MSVLFALIAALTLAACAWKPSPAPLPMVREAESTSAASEATVERGIRVEMVPGPVPWTHLNVKDSGASFQFAIVTDRTGGMRPGVFASAVPKINLMNPELVMSVGDLIQGYTEDRVRLKHEWDEFDGMVAGLNAPFFYVPGNHDITNSVMREVWHERYGPSRYAFVYKDVLFVCLDAMDGGLHQIGEAQREWLGETLAKHMDVSWTLVFLHSPFWDAGTRLSPDEDGTLIWDEVERVLGVRRYTAFAGHYHRYTKHVRNDRKHFTLATTGGISSLRGPRYGEFDHMMWVTMTPDGPLIANLMLDGIWDEDVRTESMREFQAVLMDGDGLRPVPLFHDGKFREGATRVRLTNHRDVPYGIELVADPPSGITVEPRELSLTVAPNSVLEQDFTVKAKSFVAAEALAIPVRWRAHSIADSQSIDFVGQMTIGVVQELKAAAATTPIRIDGDLAEWSRLAHEVRQPRQVQKQPKSWHGPDDSRFSFDVRSDEHFVVVAIEVVDDAVIADAKTPPWEQDGIELRVDARPEPFRSHYAGARDGRDVLLVAISPSNSAADVWLYRQDWITPVEGLLAASVRTRTGYVTEVAIPRSWVEQHGGKGAAQIRVNIAVNDGDADGQSQTWWWPDWRTSEQIPGSGTFALK
jgi:hypothetical protein